MAFNKVIRLLLCLLVLGCQPRYSASVIEEDPKLPHHVKDASDQLILGLEKRLALRNVRIMTVGEHYLIQIPAAVLFAQQSPRLKWDAYGVLNDIACYLRQYRKISVQVSTYTSQYGSIHRQKALSLARSKEVADYLWSQSIESRFVFAYGHGEEKPLSSHVSSKDEQSNSRVEITFKRVEA